MTTLDLGRGLEHGFPDLDESARNLHVTVHKLVGVTV